MVEKPTTYYVEYGYDWEKLRNFRRIRDAVSFAKRQVETCIIRARRNIRDITPAAEHLCTGCLTRQRDAFLEALTRIRDGSCSDHAPMPSGICAHRIAEAALDLARGEPARA